MTFDEMVARSRARRAKADAVAATGESHAMRHPVDRGGFVVVSPDVRAAATDAWRVTYFDATGEATGHFEADNAQAAYREMFAGGYEIADDE